MSNESKIGSALEEPLPSSRRTRWATTHHVLCGNSLREGVEFIEQHGLVVDLVATSPPFNCGADYDIYKDALALDDYLALIGRFLEAADRVLRPGGRLALNLRDVRLGTGSYYPILVLLHHELCERRGYKYRRSHTWSKIAAHSNQKAWGSFRSSANPCINSVAEPIFVFQKAGPHKHGHDNITKVEFAEATREIWEVPPVRRVHHKGRNIAGHPCPWPVQVVQRIVKLYSSVGDLVWDPFGGIGSTSIGCALSDRSSISSDISPAYCDRAVERLRLEVPDQHNITVERVDLEVSRDTASERAPEIHALRNIPVSLGEAARVRLGMKHEAAFLSDGRRRMAEGGRRAAIARRRVSDPASESHPDGSGRLAKPTSRDQIAELLGLRGRTYARGKRVLLEYDRGRCPIGGLYETGVIAADAANRARLRLSADEQGRIVDCIMRAAPSERSRLSRRLLQAPRPSA